jgi:acyl-coenzyme A thioesterase PaaI-like protein
MAQKSIQDYYPDDYAICYGCGRLNNQGHQIKSYWDGNETVCRYQPEPFHTGAQNFVYGGLVASLIDCHAAGTAAAALHRKEGKKLGVEPLSRFVTASLQVDYLAPVLIDQEILMRATIDEIKGRKVVVAIDLFSKDTLCAKGKVVAVQIPDDYLSKYN